MSGVASRRNVVLLSFDELLHDVRHKRTSKAFGDVKCRYEHGVSVPLLSMDRQAAVAILRSGERGLRPSIPCPANLHSRRDSTEAHLTVVFIALIVSRWIVAGTGWYIKKFVPPPLRVIWSNKLIRAGIHAGQLSD